jgi:hypothetical protein
MIEDVARRAVARLEAGLIAQAAADLPDLAVTRGDGGVVIGGPGLALRRLRDARLRVLGRSAAR